MQLHGRQILGREVSGRGEETFRGANPATGQPLEPAFREATKEETGRAVELAWEAFQSYRQAPRETRARLLEAAAERIEGLGGELIERTMAETGLPEARLTGERGRTVQQLRLFAEVVREGSWVEARIDTADPQRKPLPKPDVRRMLIPLGPVAVFGASNFPLAFSVAGGDTASALAAGCPVVVKGHPAHPGTSELVARALRQAVEACGLHDGVFSLLQSSRPEISVELVGHPRVRAVGFTGSLGAGRALFDHAAARSEPIPVYAEMGSVNPVFLLPGALEERAEGIADGLLQSVTLGVGQFCTNPGLVVGIEGPGLSSFLDRLLREIQLHPPGSMLTKGILEGYREGVRRFSETPGVKAFEQMEPRDGSPQARACLFTTKAEVFLSEPHLSDEVFGPSTLLVECSSPDEPLRIARGLQGHLTATLHGTEKDLEEHSELVAVLEDRVGRLIFNGFPTGVEVCHAMHHGGPYPATTDSRSTSVGTAAITRFARPVCYQNFPPDRLPEELQNRNTRRIWRLVDGRLTRDDLE